MRYGRWKKIHRGVWLRERVFKRRKHWSRITLRIVRFDPELYSVELYWGEPKFASQIIGIEGVIAAINGGPFLPNNRPWGLFVSLGEKISDKLIARKYDGICRIKGGKVKLEMASKWDRKIERGMSVFQSSPMFVYDAKPVPLPPRPWKVDRRSAICIDRRGFILLFSTLEKFNGLSYYELRRLMQFSEKRGGFSCRWALNLDGGSSSQMGVKVGGKLLVADGQKPSPLYLLLRPIDRDKRDRAKDRP